MFLAYRQYKRSECLHARREEICSCSEIINIASIRHVLSKQTTVLSTRFFSVN